MSITRIQTGPRASKAVIHNGVAYLAGQVADDTSVGARGQTEQILAKIDKLLAEAGTDKSKLIWAQLWVSDMGHFNEMNAVWDAWVSPGNTPVRACVEAKLATPQYKVEIMVKAAV